MYAFSTTSSCGAWQGPQKKGKPAGPRARSLRRLEVKWEQKGGQGQRQKAFIAKAEGILSSDLIKIYYLEMG